MALPIQRIIISAPFGNYLTTPGVTSTLGTYTNYDRAGTLRWRLFWRILRTLRWRPGLRAWTNKLGLPNPGIGHLLGLGKRSVEGRILSIHGFDEAEWTGLLTAAKIARNNDISAIELNISCPNIGHVSVPPTLFKRALETRIPVIAKLPPVNYWETYKLAYDEGVRYFHCCNTLPVPAGGMSGKPLMGVSLDVIKRIKDHTPDVLIIGGGGITCPDDITAYYNAGAEHFAVASVLLRPKLWFSVFRDQFLFKLSERADNLMSARLNERLRTERLVWVPRTDAGASTQLRLLQGGDGST